MASAAGFQGSLPESLLSVLQNGGGNYYTPTGGGRFNSLGSSGGANDPSHSYPFQPQSSVIFGEPSQFSDYLSHADAFHGLSDYGLTGPSEPVLASSSSPGFVAISHDFQELNPAYMSLSPTVPLFPAEAAEFQAFQQQDDPLVAEVVPATLTLLTNTNLGTTLSDILNDIGDAINNLITAIQNALNLDSTNDLLALLLLLGLILLPFLLSRLGHSGGDGWYHRRVYYEMGARTMAADTLRLSEQILENIEKLEQLFTPHEHHSI